MTDTDRMVVWLREAMDAAQRDAEAAARAFPDWDYDEFVKEIRDVPNAGTVAFIAVTEYGPHIARHSPAAVLRRIAADRKALTLYAETVAIRDRSAASLRAAQDRGDMPDPCVLDDWSRANRETAFMLPLIEILAEGWGWIEEAT